MKVADTEPTEEVRVEIPQLEEGSFGRDPHQHLPSISC